jgi:hypothetical protein
MYEPQVGDEFPVELLFSLSGFEKLVSVPVLSPAWTCILKEPFDPSDALDDSNPWVYRLERETKTVYLTLSRFGVYPISDRMWSRYNCAVDATLDFLSSGTPDGKQTAQSLSEVKGMYNRTLRRDQWDWFSVYEALGRPSEPEARKVVEWLVNLRTALVGADVNTVTTLLQMRTEEIVMTGLGKARKYLHETYAGLKGGRMVSQKSELDHRPANLKKSVTYDAVKTERASAVHQRTLENLNSFLRARGFRVECNVYVDAYTRLKTGPAFFEIKSISPENELTQVRNALSQLYEYRFRHKLEGATLWIVLSSPPVQSWMSEYFVLDREVFLLWIEGQTLAGPSLDLLSKAA